VGQDHELDTVSVIGGVKIGPQIDRLAKVPDIVVATPGRLLDHLERGTVHLGKIVFLVLDEADHMLDLGFLPQIQAVLQALPKVRQTMLFSATMPPAIARLTARFMNDPVDIDFRPEGRTAAGIEHRLYLVAEPDKLPCVKALLEEIEGSTLIFTRRKIEAEWLARQLQTVGYLAERLHSDRSQSQRVQALRAFRNGTTRVLVATDVAARGLDVPRIGHVINFDFPEMVEDYVHRAGRTARGSAAGIVSSVGTWKDKITVREIERAIGQPLTRFQVAGVEPWTELPKRKVIRRRLL
jgi:ATP-dependent RNA helicase RhlE